MEPLPRGFGLLFFTGVGGVYVFVLEALAAWWFWTQFSSALVLPEAPLPLLPTVAGAEAAWQTPEGVWTDPLATAQWKRHWQELTGCCVDFVWNPEDGTCKGLVRLAHAKSVQMLEGWRMGFVAVACG